MTAAALLPPPPAPPHDPLWISLGGCVGWRLAEGATTLAADARDNALQIAPLPGTAPVLGDPTGSLGGLLPPAHVAIDGQGGLWLLDRGRRRLRRFDRCGCAFVDLPCGQLALADPRAIAVEGERLYIADAAGPGRVLVVDTRALVLRATLLPPAQPQPWQPVAVAVRRGQIVVADAANGRLHIFAGWGGWLKAWDGTGAPSRLAFDLDGRLYAVIPGLDAVTVRDTSGRIVATPADPDAVACAFPAPPFRVGPGGEIDLSRWCPAAGWFDQAGNPVQAPAAAGPIYPVSAVAITTALDSRIARCQWHRLVVAAEMPLHCAVRIATATAEVPLGDVVVAGLADSAWTPVPPGGDGTGEALVMSPPGRYAWLRITIEGDGVATPRIGRIDVEYPRISLRRHLPAAFGADPVSAAFADRLLAVFDTGLRGIESAIDGQAALFDPRSAPAHKDRDFLSWLAGWIGITVDQRWPEARRRGFLRLAARLFACRGTAVGLRGALLLWLGWDRLDGLIQRRPLCAPLCADPPTTPPLPLLVLEHWKLRRWLFLGQGRLGDAAVLWGSRILGRSRLDETARTGATRLDAVRDPLRDPFHENAHRISVFLPARAVATPAGRGAAMRLLAENKPAHVEARIIAVHPRMRIGVQASLGFDAVIGCWPSGITLGEAALGRGTVLSSAMGRGVATPRLGHDARLIQPASRPSFASIGEATP
jgi:phage tail-like protein